MEDIAGLELRGNQGTYMIEKLVARGPRSNVYRAVWKERQQHVCVKILTMWLDDNSIRQLHREEVITSRLHHPNIVAVFDAGVFGDRSFTVMEFAPDGSLADKLRVSRPIRLSEAVPIVLQIAGSLEYVHSLGIVHKDVKPSNILLDGNRAILSDFGIARVVGETFSATQSGGDAGTPAYMSPEQALGASIGIGPESDQYSLAVVAFEVLTGRVPFVGGNVFELIHRIAEEPPPSLRSINPTLSQAVDLVVLKALAKNPPERYESPVQFANDLARASQQPPNAPFVPRERRRQLKQVATSISLKQVATSISRRDLWVLAIVSLLGSLLGSTIGILILAVLLQVLAR